MHWRYYILKYKYEITLDKVDIGISFFFILFIDIICYLISHSLPLSLSLYSLNMLGAWGDDIARLAAAFNVLPPVSYRFWILLLCFTFRLLFSIDDFFFSPFFYFVLSTLAMCEVEKRREREKKRRKSREYRVLKTWDFAKRIVSLKLNLKRSAAIRLQEKRGAKGSATRFNYRYER